MSAFERAAALFGRLVALPVDEREAALAREADDEVRALAREMLAGEDDPVGGLETGLPGAAALIEGALASSGEDDVRFELANGPYRVSGVLARGGMGVVLRGRDEDIGRDVAIKVLRDDSHGDSSSGSESSARLRFVEEAQVAGQLEHPGIVPVYHLGRDDAGRPFFAMKLVEGETLAEQLASRSAADEDRGRFLALFLRVCETVAYAHARRVIHRDLKPANVMVGAFGEVQVLDWGLAKVLGGPERASGRDHRAAPETVRTRSESGSASVSGTVMGTPSYMPPEQAQGEVERLDERSDVFSLGAILCELLTGEPPFPGSRKEALAAARAARVEPALERLARCGADPALVELARRALAARPEDRPTNAGELAKAVERSLAATEARAHAAELAAEAARGRADAERRARKVTTVLTSAAALLAVALVALFLWRSAERQRAVLSRSAEVGAALDVVDERFAIARTAPPLERAPWDAAAVALDAAESVLVGGETSASVRERFDRLRADFASARSEVESIAAELERDRRMAARLEEIRAPTGHGRDPFDYPRMEAGYRAAFADYGVDVDDPGAARERLRECGIAARIGPALDQWALCYQTLSNDGSSNRDARTRELLALASIADPDPVRVRVREAKNSNDLMTLHALAQDAEALEPETVILLAGGLRMQGDDETSADLLRRAALRHPGDFWLCFQAATALCAATEVGASEEALAYFHGALGARPSSLEARHLLAQDLVALGRIAEARDHFAELVRLDPDDGHWLAHLGQCTVRLEGRAAALPLFAEAVLLAPDNAYALSWYGTTLRETGDVWQSVAPLRRAHQLEPDANSLSLLAQSLDMTGAIVEAAEVRERFVETHPDEWKVLYNLGTTERSLGRLDRAERFLRRCIEANPEFPQGHCNLGGVLMDLGRFDEAAEEYRRCDELGRRAPDWGYPCGEWIERAERAAQTARTLEGRSAGGSEEDAPATLELAEVALARGFTALSSEAYLARRDATGGLEIADKVLAAQALARAAAGDGEDARALPAARRNELAAFATLLLDEIREVLMAEFRQMPHAVLADVRGWLEGLRVDPAYADLRASSLPESAAFWDRVDADLREIAATFDSGE